MPMRLLFALIVLLSLASATTTLQDVPFEQTTVHRFAMNVSQPSNIIQVVPLATGIVIARDETSVLWMLNTTGLGWQRVKVAHTSWEQQVLMETADGDQPAIITEQGAPRAVPPPPAAPTLGLAQTALSFHPQA